MELTLTGALVIGINALTGVVVFLFLRIERINKDRDTERGKLTDRIIRLERWAGMLSNCPMIECPFNDVQIPADDGDDTTKLER